MIDENGNEFTKAYASDYCQISIRLPVKLKNDFVQKVYKDYQLSMTQYLVNMMEDTVNGKLDISPDLINKRFNELESKIDKIEVQIKSLINLITIVKN